jgi:hypothetical protein
MARRCCAVIFSLFAWSAFAEQICFSTTGNFDHPDSCKVLTSLRHVQVAASDEARRFLFIHDARQGFVIGIQPPRQTAVNLETGGGALQLVLDGAKVRGWPVETKFEIANAARESWRWTFSAEQVKQAITIVLAPGEYTYSLTADGHEFLKKTFTMPAGRPHAENITLRPTLRIAAHAISSRANEVVAFPTMTADCERKLCEGTVNGDVRCDVPRSAKTICIEHPQYGRKRIAVDPAQTDLDLGDVTVNHGARVTVAPSPDVELPKGTTVALLKKRRELERHPLDTLALFEDVDPGDYRLLVAGPEPLQRKIIPLKLAESADQRVVVAITPFKLTGDVHYGDSPIPNARIELMEHDWKSQLEADDHGKFAAQMWDAAEFATLITGGVLTEPFGMMKRVSESDSDWSIRIPDRAIRGTVRDSASGTPIAGATIVIESVGTETHFNRRVESDAHGAYAISGATDGDHTLTVKAADYCVSDPISVHLGEGDGSRTLDFTLSRGVSIELAVADASGAPLSGAAVVDDVTPDGARTRRILMTERDGRVRVPLPAGARKMIYVIPRNGSIAVELLSEPHGEPHEIRVVVPAGDCAIRLRALLDSGQPLTGLVPRVRLNGVAIPDAVMRLYAQLSGISLTTDAAGEVVLPRIPAGLYELTLDKRGNDWTRIALASGETTVVQRFTSN